MKPDNPCAARHGHFPFKTLNEVTLKQCNMKPFDFSAMLDIQRKNRGTFSEAGQLTLESGQAVIHRQAEIFSQIIGDTSSIMQEAAK